MAEQGSVTQPLRRNLLRGVFVLAGLLCVVGGLVASAYYVRTMTLRLSNMEGALQSLRGDLDEARSAADERDSAVREHVGALAGVAYKLEERTAALEERMGGVSRDFDTITDSVELLEKLARTDPELLQKYSKVFFLNEHYAPERLAEIPAEYRYHNERTERLHAAVWPSLKRLMDEAKEDGVELYVKSAYRSFEEQKSLKSAYTVTYGAGSANQFSADQGYSEHQLGTTVDLITTGLGGSLAGFGNTAAYKWLTENAYRFGFVLSYPEGNSYYVYEPWHWRFVGKDLARELHKRNAHFYDLDQREIDEYLPELF